MAECYFYLGKILNNSLFFPFILQVEFDYTWVQIIQEEQFLSDTVYKLNKITELK